MRFCNSIVQFIDISTHNYNTEISFSLTADSYSLGISTSQSIVNSKYIQRSRMRDASHRDSRAKIQGEARDRKKTRRVRPIRIADPRTRWSAWERF